MIITRVNGNEIQNFEVDVSYEDVIKALFIIPVVEQWAQEYAIEGVSLEDFVDAIYTYCDHYDGYWDCESVADSIVEVIKNNGWTEVEIDEGC